MLQKIGFLSAVLAGSVSAFYNPMNTKMVLLNENWGEVSIETDYFAGGEFKAVPHPSDYPELTDEMEFNMAFKQSFRVNWSIMNTYIESHIFEITWVDFTPFGALYYFTQAESFNSFLNKYFYD